MDKWEAITGIILFLVGIGVAWQNYNTVTSCNSLGGKISTFFGSLLGANPQQACYNAQIAVVGAVIVALIGLAIIYASAQKQKRKK
jgi:putative Mn2+ efflux pump MntP